MPPTFKKTASSKGEVGAKALADNPTFFKPEGEEASEINARAEAKAEAEGIDEVSASRYLYWVEGVEVPSDDELMGADG